MDVSFSQSNKSVIELKSPDQPVGSYNGIHIHTVDVKNSKRSYLDSPIPNVVGLPSTHAILSSHSLAEKSMRSTLNVNPTTTFRVN